ncbi:MAG: MG2 domain-containing protein [Bacteroidota bacterium]|nr:MG2 domain-containing protein [Bacteroidota bacterium]
MKRNIIFITLTAMLVILLAAFSGSKNTIMINPDQIPEPYDTLKYQKLWKQADDFLQDGLPRSASDVVDKIYLKARQEQNPPMFIKAVLYRIRVLSDYEEDFKLRIIADLNKDIDQADFPENAVLHSILASLYHDYYQQNRYKFMDRSETEKVDKDDIETWDLRHIMDKIGGHYRASLARAAYLKKIPVRDYTSILEKEKNSDLYRPTLYDFLAHRALDFFMNDENSLTRPAFVFQFDDKKYFDEAEKFARQNIESRDTSSLKYQAILLLQDLIAFHLEDENPAALVDVDLKRLEFVRQHIAGISNPDELYLQAMQYLREKYAENQASTMVLYQMALLHEKLGNQFDAYLAPQYRLDLKKAVELCEEAISSFPKSIGANNCQVVLERIKSVHLSLQTASIEVPRQPILALLSFRNTGKAEIRLVKTNYDDYRQIERKQQFSGLSKHYAKYEKYAVKTIELPDAGDYQLHKTQISLPALEPGFYVILISSGQALEEKEDPDGMSTLNVSKLAYISNRKEKGDLEFFVLDRKSGEPQENVVCKVYSEAYDYQKSRLVEEEDFESISDRDGHVLIRQSEAGRRFSIRLIHKQDSLQSNEVFYAYPAQEAKEPESRTFFFTDRSIYRPGQTVYFKGIMLEKNGENDKILPGKSTEVSFYDVNGQKVSSLQLKSNDYGSFHGSFIAPTGVLTGQMHIKNEDGRVWFRVEEYKRPKFEVVFDPVKGNYKLDEQVSVKGKAKAYAGNPINDALLSYRVVRNVRMPYWRWWWGYMPFESSETEITNGTTFTNDEGEFEIDFTAIPDLSIRSSFDPVFDFTVYADVTDINGETRSGSTSISVGEKALILQSSLTEKVNRETTESFKILAKNPSGEEVAASGTLKIFRLQPPERIFRKRLWERPDVFILDQKEFYKDFSHDLYDNENEPSTWARSEALLDLSFASSENKEVRLDKLQSWDCGIYLLEMRSEDAFGQAVNVEEYFTLYSPKEKEVPASELSWFLSLQEKAEVGDVIPVLIGSAAKDVHAIYEVRSKDGLESRQWIKLDRDQESLEEKILENYRGNIQLSMQLVKFNRFYSASQLIVVPYSNKKLDISLETFRDKLKPGQEEEWRLKISGPDGDAAAAELLASMYDASLDAFSSHSWNFSLYHNAQFWQNWESGNNFQGQNSRFYPEKGDGHNIIRIEYDQLNWFGFQRWWNYRYQKSMMMGREADLALEEVEVVANDMEANKPEEKKEEPLKGDQSQEEMAEAGMNIRKDFRETAFFFPQMHTDSEGNIILKFTMPEALTRWKFMTLAYTKDLKTAQLQKEVVTQKELMLMPNAPRFFREGDTLYFNAKVVSMVDETMQGEAELEFFNALNMQKISDRLQIDEETRSFSLDKKGSTSVSWKIIIPEGLETITYRIKARTQNFSDGEEMALPVLPNRMLVTESLPLPVRANESKHFRFGKLIESGKSKTLDHYRLTLEYTSNPAWYAVQALPYLMEYPYECSEQVFSRYYANSLAHHIASSDPKIRRVFDAWKQLSPDALLSNLEKNQELKSLLLEETPWVRQAKSESERKKRIALLFDMNKMLHEMEAALSKLHLMQLPSGAWPWFHGMPENRYITQYILTGLARLKKLGAIDPDVNDRIDEMMEKGISYLDKEIRKDLKELEKREVDLKADNLSRLQIQYLYLRSYLMDLFDVASANLEAFNYYTGQANQYWLNKDLYMQGMIALALDRFGNESTPSKILASLKEKALHSEEMGMYWRKNDGWFWYQAPIERQAMLIEAFDEISHDSVAVEEMKVWLLKQKQTQDWKTTTATANAIYALLLRGTDLLSNDELVEISLGGVPVDPIADETKVEAGTGYFKKTWEGSEINADMGKVKISNPNEHIAWGALFWQYFEDLDKITPHASPLSIEKDLFLEKNTDRGPVIEAIGKDTELNVGDRVKVRIIIRSDRDMEYIHLKDMRAAAFEPVNVLSGYRWQGGLGYYESTRDASTNFFISYLPKGTYVFEYAVIASQKGLFSNGITSIQCMYAPEFGSHSEGIRVRVE